MLVSDSSCDLGRNAGTTSTLGVRDPSEVPGIVRRLTPPGRSLEHSSALVMNFLRHVHSRKTNVAAPNIFVSYLPVSQTYKKLDLHIFLQVSISWSGLLDLLGSNEPIQEMIGTLLVGKMEFIGKKIK